MNTLRLALFLLTTCILAHADNGPRPPAYNESIDNGDYGFYPTRSYVTQQDLMSPATNFLQWSPECDDGLYYFITPRGHSVPNPGPMILDRRGELVWSHHFENTFGGEAYDLMVQSYQGQDYLTFWLGDDRIRGHGSGFYYMLNSSYDIVHKIGGANGMSADLHEFSITPEGTALMTIYEIVPGDVSVFRKFDPVKHPEDNEPNYVWDGAFQEIDLETGDLLFEWRASEHYNISETYRPIYDGGTKMDPWDWFHINSIQKDELGNFLISARYPHILAYIDGGTKQIIWQLGGKRNDFMDLSGGNAINFAWQHDASFISEDAFPNLHTPPPERPGFTTQLVTLFDNAAEDQHYSFGLLLSRGLLLEITYPTPGTEKALSGETKTTNSDIDLSKRETEDEKKIPAINGSDPNYTVRLINSYENPNGVRSSSQGSMQILPQRSEQDPKVFVGYGLNAVWTEFDANGTVLCDVHFGAKTSWERGDIQSYRAFKFEWKGQPEWSPSVEISDDDVELYVSWLGATEVEKWVLQCSSVESQDEDAWTDLVSGPKNAFETAITIPREVAGSRYLRIIALSAGGARLDYGASRILDRGIIATYFPRLNKVLPAKVAHMLLLRVFMIISCSISLLFIIYEVYRRYLMWWHGGYGGGPLMWRKSPAYRLLVDV